MDKTELAFWLAKWFVDNDTRNKCNYTCIDPIDEVCLDGDWNFELLAETIIEKLKSNAKEESK